MFLGILLVITSIIVSVCLFVWFVVWSIKRERAREAIFRADHEKWLVGEKFQPRWALKIRLTSGEEIISAGIPATVNYSYSIENAQRITSKSRTQRCAHEIVTGESICKVDGRYFPHAQIREVTVIPENVFMVEKSAPVDMPDSTLN